jgi:hypothetical protein
MTGDHHGQAAGMTTLLVRALDAILGTHNPQPWFSVASRSMSAVISALTGGRPVWFG